MPERARPRGPGRPWRLSRVGGAALAGLAALLALIPLGSPGQAQPEALPSNVRIGRLVLDKSDHLLHAYAGERLVRSYRVAIGSGGLGPKRWEGDRRTPEGEYRIDSRHRSRDYHRFLHVSYPNAGDRARYRRLRRAGDVPEGRGIGSAIGIHGPPTHPFGFLVQGDWTAGCVAIGQREIEELYRAVVPNAPITIRR